MKLGNISRRNFMATLATAGVALPLTGISLSNPAVSLGKMDICMFSKPLEWLTIDELAIVLKRVGFDGVDLTVRPNGHVLPENVKSDLPKASKAFKSAGVSLPMITTSIISTDEPNTREIVKAASNAGVKFYRMGYLPYNDKIGMSESLEALKPQISRLVELNKQLNIHAAYQNHVGTRVGGPVWDIWYLIKDFDPNYIGCQYDIRHAVAEGGTSWSNALKLIAPYIKTIVIKDFLWMNIEGKWRPVSVPLGEGMVDFNSFFQLVKQLNINAPISVHYEYPLLKQEDEKLSKAEKIEKVVPVLQKDLEKLKEMLRLNDLY